MLFAIFGAPRFVHMHLGWLSRKKTINRLLRRAYFSELKNIGGSSAHCSVNLRTLWKHLLQARTNEYNERLFSTFRSTSESIRSRLHGNLKNFKSIRFKVLSGFRVTEHTHPHRTGRAFGFFPGPIFPRGPHS